MTESNPALYEYKRELVKKKNEIIRDIRKKQKTGVLKTNDALEAEINTSIVEKIFPVEEKYAEIVGEELSLDLLELVSNKIRTAFAPKTAVVESELTSHSAIEEVDQQSDSDSDLDQESIVESPNYKDLQEKKRFYARASRKIGEIIEKISKESDAVENEDLIIELEPYLDIFISAGMKINYVVSVKNPNYTDSDDNKEVETFSVHKNSAVLIRDVARALTLLSQNQYQNLDSSMRSFVDSVFGRLQVDSANIPINDRGKKTFLVRKFNELITNGRHIGEVPSGVTNPRVKDFKTQLVENNNSLLGQALKYASSEERKYQDVLSEVEMENNEVFIQGQEKLKGLLDDFAGRHLKSQGWSEISDGHSNDIPEKTQKELYKELRSFSWGAFVDLDKQSRVLIEEKTRLENKFFKEKDRLEKVGESTAELYDVFQSSLLEIETRRELVAFFTRELERQRDEFATKWGLDAYLKSIELMDVDQLKIWEIIDYVIDKEVAFWEPLHMTSQDKFTRELVARIKYNLADGVGYEDNDARNGVRGYWATAEGRKQMLTLQQFALFGLGIGEKEFAQGKVDNLFDNLAKIKMTRESMLVATTEDPIIGNFLYKVLDIAQYWPTLRTGKLPSANFLADPDVMRAHMTAENFVVLQRRLNALSNDPDNSGGLKVLNERIVLRNGRRIQLAADSFVENESDPDDWVFRPGEEMLPGDILLLEASSKYNYMTLSGNRGKSVAKEMMADIISDLKKNYKKHKLSEMDVPNEDDERSWKSISFFANTTFYVFPYLEFIFTRFQNQTQTGSHDKNKFGWGKYFGPGHWIHPGFRYNLPAPVLWDSVYYKKFPDGLFGPSGFAEDLNDIRERLIAFLRASYGREAADHFVEQIDPRDIDGMMGAVLTPLSLITRKNQECVACPVDFRDKNGRLTNPSGKRGDGKNPAYSWDLFLVFKTGVDYLMEVSKAEMESGSTGLEMFKKDDNPFYKIGQVGLGMGKMWFCGTRENPDYDWLEQVGKLHALQGVFRQGRSIKSKDTADLGNKRSFAENVIIQLKKWRGESGGRRQAITGLATGSALAVVNFLLDCVRGVGDRSKYFKETEENVNGVVIKRDSISIGFAPLTSYLWGNRESGLIKDSERFLDIRSYLQTEWERESAEHVSSSNPSGWGEFPFANLSSKQILLNMNLFKFKSGLLGINTPILNQAHFDANVSYPRSQVTQYMNHIAMQLIGHSEIEAPLNRPKPSDGSH